MLDDQRDEVVFHVDGPKALQLDRIPLADLSLMERQHLQEWVIANPAVVAPDMMVITFEFDVWDKKVKDRLDVLGLGADGRLVVVELKRGTAPDTTDVQAIKYAAMASRFTVEMLADRYRQFLATYRSEPVDADEARARIDAHTNGLASEETLRRPRIVLMAEDFSRTVTSSAVWLSEMGLDMSLVTFRAYRTPSGDTVVTSSQLWPLPQAESFVVAPRAATTASVEELPEIPWSDEDLSDFAENSGTIMLAMIDRLAQSPGMELANSELGIEGYTTLQTAGASGAISRAARSRYKRANAPIRFSKLSGGWKYVMDVDIAERWRALRGLETVSGESSATGSTIS